MKSKQWIALCLLFLPVTVEAQTAADRAFAECGAIVDAKTRLACYDGARDQSKVTHWPEFSTAQTHNAPADATSPRNTAPAPAAPSSPDRSLVARVIQYSFSPHGQFTVTLGNGEVWRQLDSDDGIARFKHSTGNMVQISKGFWGSYDLRLNAANTVFKVTRIK